MVPTFESRNAKLQRVIDYIKSHPDATGWEVVGACNVSRSLVNKTYSKVYPGKRIAFVNIVNTDGKVTRGRPRTPAATAILRFFEKDKTLTYREIAEQFGVSVQTVGDIYRANFGSKRRPESNTYAPMLTHEQRRERKKELLTYARDNESASIRELAEKFGLAASTVNAYLAKHGVPCKGRWGGRLPADPARFMREDPKRVAILTQGVQEDWTLQEIGKKLKVTRERARQLLRVFHAAFPDVERPARYSVEDIHTASGVARAVVLKIAQKNGIGRIRGKDTLVFSQEEYDQFPALIEEYATHRCIACGTYFERMDSRASFCSQKCREKSYNLRLTNPNKDNRRAHQWGEVTVRVAQNKQKPSRWLSWAEAMEFAKVTSMQLVYLRKKGIVRTRPNPLGINRQGTVYTEYALEDMKIVRDFKGRPAR